MPVVVEPTFVEALGRRHAVTVPPFAEREELVIAYAAASRRGGVTLLRVHAAFLGLCTRLGREASADYAACACDPLVYGGRVYGYLREQGASPAAIAVAAAIVIPIVSEALAPRESEVAKQEGFSGAGGVGST